MVTATGTLAADVLIVGEKIAAVLARGEATDAASSPTTRIDATGTCT